MAASNLDRSDTAAPGANGHTMYYDAATLEHNHAGAHEPISLISSIADTEDRRPAQEQTAQRSSSDRTLEGDDSQNEKHEQEEDASKGGDEEQTEGPPLPVGFWHKSLKQARREVTAKWALTTLFLFVFILTVMSLYWAVLYRVEENLKFLTVAVVSFDGQVAPYAGTEPLLGRTVEELARQQGQIKSGVIGYKVKSPSEFNNDPIAVRQYVYDQHAWAAIIVNPNATALLQQAVQQGNHSYDPLGAMQMVYVQARDETTHANYITPQLNQFAVNVQAQFGEQWVKQVLSNTNLSPSTYVRAPQALSPAIGTSIFNLRPFGPQQATPAVTIGLIYLIIIAFFNFSFYLPIHMKFLLPQGHPPMHFWEMCLWRLGANTLAYCFLSLAYSLVSLAFQIPFSNSFPHNDVTVANNPDAFGHGSFVVYWMLNFVSMYALGLASENVTMVIGQPWTAMWLIFWVITNVSTSFYAVELAPGFFHWGYAWPLHQTVEASRTILFDTHSRLGLNFGILFVWCAVHTVLFFPCALVMRWKSSKEIARAAPRPTIKYLVDG